MSIMPASGWGSAPQNNSEQRSAITPRNYLVCKVCDFGTLNRKSVYRMSGPAVVIGYILLVPSILGIAMSVLLFFGVLSLPGQDTNFVEIPTQSAFDLSFRRSCAKQFNASRTMDGLPFSQPLAEQYCECTLSEVKTSRSEVQAAQTCVQRGISGELPSPTREVDSLYTIKSVHTSRPDASLRFFRVIGGVSALAIGIASFVGGLLGWLLVMKKRVLQCDTCEAVVSAS